MNSKKFLFFASFLLISAWLILCQTAFIFVQKENSAQIQMSLESQMREVLERSDFFFVGQTILELEKTKRIACPQVKINHPIERVLIPLPTDPFCQTGHQAAWMLGGAPLIFNLKTRNGEVYQFSMISVNHSTFYLSLWSVRLSGILLILTLMILYFYSRRVLMLEHESRTKILEERTQISRQVAHDIRSPVSVLNLVASSFSDNFHQERSLILSAAKRIDEIAADILHNRKMDPRMEPRETDERFKTSEWSPEDFVDRIRALVKEKALEFSKKEVSFPIQIQGESSPLQILPITSHQLTRIVSNILNNSAEASGSQAEVQTLISVQSHRIRLSIVDYGTGIAPEVLAQIGKAEVSSKSKSGRGLGLLNAFRLISSVQGQINILSKEGVGTSIEIVIPTQTGP